MNQRLHMSEQATSPKFFLERIGTNNQKQLLVGLFRSAAQQRNVTRPDTVVTIVARDLARRTFQSLGESEGSGYASSLTAMQNYPREAERFALAALQHAGKQTNKAIGGHK
jgi:hypothetical protein